VSSPAPASSVTAPGIESIRRARRELGDRVRTTPVWTWRSDRLAELLPAGTEVTLKLELFQHAGTFKPRGAQLMPDFFV
jgi:threonine dehydratase